MYYMAMFDVSIFYPVETSEKIQAITTDVSKVYDLLAICETFLTENVI